MNQSLQIQTHPLVITQTGVSQLRNYSYFVVFCGFIIACVILQTVAELALGSIMVTVKTSMQQQSNQKQNRKNT